MSSVHQHIQINYYFVVNQLYAEVTEKTIMLIFIDVRIMCSFIKHGTGKKCIINTLTVRKCIQNKK